MDQIQKLQHELAYEKLENELLRKSYEKADQCAIDREVQIWSLQREIKRWKEHTDKLERDLEEVLVHNGNLIGKLSRSFYLGTQMHLLKDRNSPAYKSVHREFFTLKYPELSEEKQETITKARVIEIVNDMAGDYPGKFNKVKNFDEIDPETLKIATEDGCFGHYTVVD